jgi:hypothetical protein
LKHLESLNFVGGFGLSATVMFQQYCANGSTQPNVSLRDPKITM